MKRKSWYQNWAEMRFRRQLKKAKEKVYESFKLVNAKNIMKHKRWRNTIVCQWKAVRRFCKMFVNVSEQKLIKAQVDRDRGKNRYKHKRVFTIEWPRDTFLKRDCAGRVYRGRSIHLSNIHRWIRVVFGCTSVRKLHEASAAGELAKSWTVKITLGAVYRGKERRAMNNVMVKMH